MNQAQPNKALQNHAQQDHPAQVNGARQRGNGPGTRRAIPAGIGAAIAAVMLAAWAPAVPLPSVGGRPSAPHPLSATDLPDRRVPWHRVSTVLLSCSISRRSSLTAPGGKVEEHSRRRLSRRSVQRKQRERREGAPIEDSWYGCAHLLTQRKTAPKRGKMG